MRCIAFHPGPTPSRSRISFLITICPFGPIMFAMSYLIFLVGLILPGKTHPVIPSQVSRLRKQPREAIGRSNRLHHALPQRLLQHCCPPRDGPAIHAGAEGPGEPRFVDILADGGLLLAGVV